MALATSPPHTRAVHRVLKNAYRLYATGATGSVTVINPIASLTVGQNVIVSGTTTVGAGVALPPSVTIQLRKGAAVQKTQTVTVSGAGLYTSTFVAGAASAGTNWNVVVTWTGDTSFSTTSPNFTVT